ITQLSSLHPETQHCPSEPFGKTCRRAQVESLRINSAKKQTIGHPESRPGGTKDLVILRRPALSWTPQNDNRKNKFPDGH
ncbi:MAG: hypothetical protein P8017_05855, partial [Deltaproteobacteria bacterium]